MKKRLRCLTLFTLISFSLFAQQQPDLGAATPFTVLAKTGIQNTDNTAISGKVGVYPGLLVAGLDLNLLQGILEIGTPAANQAQQDLARAYNHLAGQAPTENLTGQPLSGKVLKPGVYRFDQDLLLSGDLILENGGNPNGTFIFQVNGDLTLRSWAAILFSEATKPRIQNVFWQVKGRVAIGEGCSFLGSVLARQNITLQNSTQVQGRLLTSEGQVRLSGNQITLPTDLAVSVAKSPGATMEDIYFIDEPITFTITATNRGPIGEKGVRVRSLLPPGISYVASTATISSYDPATATWSIPDFPNGATHTLEITGKINNRAVDFVAHSASIAGNGMDELLANNSSFISSICVAPANPGTIQGPAAICSRSSDNVFRVDPIPGAQHYNWLLPSGWTVISGHDTNAITVRAGTASGTITLTVGNVCAVSTSSKKTVAVSAPLALAPAPISTNQARPCVGAAGITYRIPEVQGAESYLWEVPTGWLITAGQGTPTITVTAGEKGGEVRVTARNGCGDSPARELPVAPTVNTLPAPGEILTQGRLCTGTTLTFSVAAVPGASRYTWAVPAGWQVLSGAGTATITVEAGAAAGEVRVRASNDCVTGESAGLAVSPVSPLVAGAVSGPATPCPGAPVSYSVGDVAGATGYAWTVPAGWQITGGQHNATIIVTAGPTAGAVSVAAINACGPGPASTRPVEPASPLAAPGAITASQPLPCVGAANIVYAIAPVAGASSYSWSLPAGWTVTGGQGTQAVTVTAAAAGGEVVVQARSACGETAESKITVLPAPGAPLAPASILGAGTPCAGQANVAYSVAPAAGALSYQWEVPEGWRITQGQGTAGILVSVGIAAGHVSVKAMNSCGAGAEKKLAVAPSLAPAPTPLAISGDTAVCAGEQVSYATPQVAGALAYAWQVPGDWTILAGQGSAAIQVKVGKTAGTVEVKTRNGCGESSLRTVLVRVHPGVPALPAPVAGPAQVCAGKAGLVYSTMALPGVKAYTWQVPDGWAITDGQGTNTITVTAGTTPGTVSVQAASPCGLSQASALAVSPAPPLPASLGEITGSTALVCQHQQVSFQVAALPGAVAYTWQVPAGWAITAGQGTHGITVIAGTAAGQVSVTARNDCGGSAAGELAVQPRPLTALTSGAITGSSTVCAGQQGLVYALAPVAGATTYTWTVPAGWEITAGQGTEKISVTAGQAPGSISVVAATSCVQAPAVSLAITSLAVPAAAPAILDLSSACDGLVYAVDDKTEFNLRQPGSYTWTVPQGWTITGGQGSRQIRVTAPAGSARGLVSVAATNGSCTGQAASLEADPALGQARLSIANAITANGDGQNDTWDIANLQNYPDNEVVILNRWGNEVYRRKAYANNWDGGGLNAGTYFYQLKVKVCDGSFQSYQGYVMVLR